VNKSTSEAAGMFNIVGQFTQMNNMLGLQTQQQDGASNYFGNDRFYSYEFDHDLVRNTSSNVPLFIPAFGNGLSYPT
jgi:hypothetical protein